MNSLLSASPRLLDLQVRCHHSIPFISLSPPSMASFTTNTGQSSRLRLFSVLTLLDRHSRLLLQPSTRLGPPQRQPLVRGLLRMVGISTDPSIELVSNVGVRIHHVRYQPFCPYIVGNALQ